MDATKEKLMHGSICPMKLAYKLGETREIIFALSNRYELYIKKLVEQQKITDNPGDESHEIGLLIDGLYSSTGLEEFAHDLWED